MLARVNHPGVMVPPGDLCDEAQRIERNFKFHNFVNALKFAQRIGKSAESKAIMLTSPWVGAMRVRAWRRRG